MEDGLGRAGTCPLNRVHTRIHNKPRTPRFKGQLQHRRIQFGRQFQGKVQTECKNYDGQNVMYVTLLPSFQTL